MKLSKDKIIALIVILAVAVAGGTYYYLYYSSGSKADISFINVTLEASDSWTFRSDLLTYKKFKFTLTYDVVGGFVPVTCKNFILNVKIEDLNVGSVKMDDMQILGEWKRNTKTVVLDLSDLSANDLWYVRDKFFDHEEELKVEIEGSATIDAIVLSKRVTPSLIKYFLLKTFPSINLVNVNWSKTSAQAGESVDFHVMVSNPYRGSQISGNLTVIVREDISWAPDEDVRTYSFSVSLDAGQSSDYNDSFTVYKNSDTRGFFLKIYWFGVLIFEMGEGYPPRLRV